MEDIEENVEADVIHPLVTLSVDMIGKGTSPRIDQIQYFIEHFGNANQKTKQCLQDNFIALIATLAFDNVSTTCDQNREMVVFQLMAISIDSIIANYRLKDYPQEKVILFLLFIYNNYNIIFLQLFRYLSGKDWSISVKTAINNMRLKSPTTSWSIRKQGSLNDKSLHEIKEAYFGSQMVVLASKMKTYISKYMTPNYICGHDLKSGQEEGDMYEAMRTLVLYPADVLTKTSLTVKRMANVIGNTFFIFYYIIHPDFFYLFSIDKEAEIKKLYDIKILSYNDLEWRPESWLTFLITGPPAGNNALVTIVPRLDPNSLVLTQSKEVRKHARQASRLAQGQTHKTRGNGSIIFASLIKS